MTKSTALIALGALGAFVLWQTFRSRDNQSSSWVNRLRSDLGLQPEERRHPAWSGPASGLTREAEQALKLKILEDRLEK